MKLFTQRKIPLLYSFIMKRIRNKKLRKYITYIYKHLYIMIFCQLDISNKEYYDRFKYTINKIKSRQEDYNFILKCLELYGNDDIEIKYTEKERGIIIAEIFTYKGSLMFGSENWCISSITYNGSLGEKTPGEFYWQNYIQARPDNPRQFFVWYLNINEPQYRLVGTTTLHDKNAFFCAYDYFNNPFNMANFIINCKLNRKIFF